VANEGVNRKSDLWGALAPALQRASKGERSASPSRSIATNGWTFWQYYKHEAGVRRSLAELRDR